ncbi:MAG: trigger factor [candidate division WOR-3 bacterium]|nr:trigger factor [candidate division WOR-3 bacterium]MCX7947599.1 trigger factor [candidate division WOR-3 bacterium]MDW8150484.1 trigger factor [candidate division WOR-3 bacterium]
MAVIPDERKALRELKLQIEKLKVLEEEDKVALEFQKFVEIPGFRKGKVPISLIKQKYKEDIKNEAIKSAIRQKIDELRSEYEIVSDVGIKDIHEADNSYEVLIEFEVIPKIELPDFTNIQVDRKIYKVSDLDVAEYIENLRKKFSEEVKVEEDREIQDDDIIIAKMEDYDKDGNLVSSEDVYIEYKKDEIDERLYRALANKKVNDIAEVKFDDGSRQVFKIQEIKVRKLPELNDEFAQINGYMDLEEMKQKIREMLEKEAKVRGEFEYETQIIDKIYEAYPFQPPSKFVINAYENIVKNMEVPKFNRKEEEKAFQEQVLSLAYKSVIRELILREVIKQKSIEVSDEEVIEYLKQRGEENPEEYIKRSKQRGQYESIIESVKMKKAFDYIKNLVRTKVIVE